MTNFMEKHGIPDGAKIALISVFNKTGIASFAEKIIDMGWYIISSGGTAKNLTEAGLKVIDVADMAGGSAILGHRVVTLSRLVHAALLARLDNPSDMAELKALGIPPIHMVVCDFYPMNKIIADPNATIDSVIEMTDIGGPTMVRSAAKGGRIVVCKAPDREWVLKQLIEFGNLTDEQIQRLRAKAEFTVAKYCAASAQFHGQGEYYGLGTKFRALAYAENKCQNPADQFSFGEDDDPLAMDKFIVEAGDPSYTAMADGNGILEIICTLADSFRTTFGNVPYLVVAGKHGNPCGAAFDWHDPNKAILNALLGDKVAVMGGEVITNFAINDELGELLHKVPEEHNIGRPFWGLDLVMAPGFSDATVALLGKKEKRRLLSNYALHEPFSSKQEWMIKPIRGGFLRQKSYPFIFSRQGIKEQIGPSLSDENFGTLILAWAVCWKASSNTVALAKDQMLIGLGCGQQDRIECVSLCLKRAVRAGHSTNGAVFASDGFFPYAVSEQTEDLSEVGHFISLWARKTLEDASSNPKAALKKWSDIVNKIIAVDNREGLELLIAAGCLGGLVPHDGQKIEEVKELCRKSNLSVAFLAPENRGFAKH